MNKRSYKRKNLIVALFIIMMLTVITMFFLNNKSNENMIYSNQYYTFTLPENWSIKEENFSISILFKNQEIAIITVEENFQYGDSIDTIVANWLSMKADIKTKSIFLTDEKEEFQKVLVGMELSAAQQMNNEEPQVDEVHYFYLSDKDVFIDIMICDNEYITLVENLIKSFSLKNDNFSQENVEESNDLSARMILETDTEQTEISSHFELTDNVKAYCEKYGISITSHAVMLNWDALEDSGTVVESLAGGSDSSVDSVGAKASDVTDSILKSSFNEAESSFTDEEKNIINAYFDVKEDMRIEICEEGFSISQKRDDRNITLNKRTLKNEETKHVYFQNSYVEEISEVEIVNREENLEVLKIKLVNDEIYEYMITNEGCCLYKISIVLAEE